MECIGCCMPRELETIGCPLYEHSVDWLHFLKLVCEHCWTFATCARHPVLLAVVDYIWNLVQTAVPIICTRGALAAAIVRAQFERTTPLPDNLFLDVNTTADMPLMPWPVLPSQYEVYSNFKVASTAFCDDTSGDDHSFRLFAPDADASAVGCSVYRTDPQLVRSCQSRRARGETFGDVSVYKGESTASEVKANRALVSKPWDFDEDLRERRSKLAALNCPRAWRPTKIYGGSQGRRRGVEDAPGMLKYQDRAEERFCSNQSGVWGENFVDYHKCVLLVVAERMGFSPGQIMLDWGSGCGHTLTWAKMYYDIDGLGIEAVPLIADWSERFAAGRVCGVDGRNIEWVPDKLFDHVFTYASFVHLEPDEQCNMAVALVRKLRIGGRAFFGWNRAHLYEPWSWYTCFKIAREKGYVSVRDIETLEEWMLFSADRDAYLQTNTWIWQFPAYSVFVTREA